PVRSVVAVSGLSGTTSEGIILNAPDLGGTFSVRVHGRNGVFVEGQPFHLQVIVDETEACGPISTVALDKNGSPLKPSTVAAPNGQYKTLILHDITRMAGSADEKTALQARLATFAAQA